MAIDQTAVHTARQLAGFASDKARRAETVQELSKAVQELSRAVQALAAAFEQ
jgi:uncharacterized protein YoxC